MAEEKIEMSDFMEFIQGIDSLIKNKKKIDLVQAGSLSNTARLDMESAKTLYEKHLYATAVYHLQQSVEKISKAYGITFFFFDEKDLKEPSIGHKTPRAFIKGVETPEIQGYIKIMQALHPELKADTKELKKVVDSGQYDIAILSKEAILSVLGTIDRLETAFKEKGTEEIMNTAFEFLSEFVHSLKKEGKKKRVKDTLDVDFLISFISLYLLSVVTYPHFAYTRYPDGKLKPGDYKEGMGIVDTTPEILKYVQRTIEYFERYLATQAECS